MLKLHNIKNRLTDGRLPCMINTTQYTGDEQEKVL